jgi:hypothetical protein
MRGRKQQLLLFGTLMIGLLNVQPASAADWRYCLASLHAQNIVYVSQTFQTDQELSAVENAFGRELNRKNLQHDSVQCPRGDAQTIAGKRAQAIRYNRANDNNVVEIDWGPVQTRIIGGGHAGQ